mmetsp:Transcript_55953/g.130775  ORF Transcript_55953/g.130775 Transcript_55953/m.130775 type:complete len:240 (+) Transcript_55953:44-763(+)
MGATGGKAFTCHQCEESCIEHAGVDMYALVAVNRTPDGDLEGSEAMAVHKLLTAAREGKEDDLAMLLRDGVAIDRRRPFFMKREQEQVLPDAAIGRRQPGMSALMYAAQGGYPNCVARLLIARADPNSLDEDGHTPLHFGASSGSIEVCKLLVAHRADLNACTDDNKTALDLVPDDARPTAKLHNKWQELLAVDEKPAASKSDEKSTVSAGEVSAEPEPAEEGEDIYFGPKAPPPADLS